MFHFVQNSPFSIWFVLPGLLFIAQLLHYGALVARRLIRLPGRGLFVFVSQFLMLVIWLLALWLLLDRLDQPALILACGLGFALGSWCGDAVVKSFSGDTVVFRLTTTQPADGLILSLGSIGVGVTIFEAIGATGEVNQLVIVVTRKTLPKVMAIVERYFAKAFYVIEDVSFVSEGARLGVRPRKLVGR